MRRTALLAIFVMVTMATGAAVIGCNHHDEATTDPGYALVSMDNGSATMPYVFRNGAFTLLKDLSPSSNPYFYTRAGGKIYFVAANATPAYCQLWVTDGTSAGTTMLKEFPETGGGIGYLTPFGDNLVFRADDGVNGTELWRTNGTVAGTQMIKDINPAAGIGGWPQQMTLYNGKLYFAADDGTHDYELWVSDGTEPGTSMLKDIKTTTPANNGSIPNEFTVYKGKLYFAAQPGSSAPGLWVTDGTAENTASVADVWPLYMKVVNDNLFVSTTDGLWVSDGTGSGTTLVKALGAGAYDLTPFSGKLLFRGTADGNNWDLWSSDGTPGGTSVVKTINATGNASVSNLFPASGLVYFKAYDGVTGRQLWSTDGTAAGTVRVTGVNVSGGGWDPWTLQDVARDHFALISGDLGATYVAGDDGTHGRELWELDGSADGAHLVSDFNPGAAAGFWID
jgi:ELWxxDGT repeat protein